MFLLIPHSIVNLDQCDMQSVDLAWDNSAANYRLAFDADETDDDVSEYPWSRLSNTVLVIEISIVVIIPDY